MRLGYFARIFYCLRDGFNLLLSSTGSFEYHVVLRISRFLFWHQRAIGAWSPLFHAGLGLQLSEIELRNVLHVLGFGISRIRSL